MAPVRFQFTIDPKTPLKDLLPVQPAAGKKTGQAVVDDLAQVPEATFQAAPDRSLPAPEAMKHTAHTIAKINFLNDKKPEAFLEALRDQRPDLHGLPFAMGDACRTKGERSQLFTQAVATIRRLLNPTGQAFAFGVGSGVTFTPPASGPAPAAPGGPAPDVNVPQTVPVDPGQRLFHRHRGAQPDVTVPQAVAVDQPTPLAPSANRPRGDVFWQQYPQACAAEDQAIAGVDGAHQENVTLARIAALMQMLAPEPPDLRLGLVKHLSGISHAVATRALARLAVFSPEDEVRRAAIEALKVRRERDYTDVLVQGLRYPWPAVARHTAEAVVKLERNDLLPQLVAVLDEADPRLPVTEEVDGKKVPVARELVRINHHQNCLLCHAPGNTGTVSPETLTAEVPTPGQPLPTPSQGYGNSTPDILVRIDVTYLRQDFSLMQPVTDAAPWPEMQRFDFLVRTRVLDEEEAQARRAKLDVREPGRLSPYQRAVVAALRDMTGLDAAPTGEAWRKLLKLPEAKP